MQSSEETTTTIRLKGVQNNITLTAPQLEAGTKASQYQPTDDTLNYTEDYGAWFSKGGIGGTIQNPLLKLGDDSSISSRDGSFGINPDGTGYFAGGIFKWTKDTIAISLKSAQQNNQKFDTSPRKQLQKSSSISKTTLVTKLVARVVCLF